MPYLLESELGLSYDLRLTEFGNMGHIVPNHGVVLEKVCMSMSVSNTIRQQLCTISPLLHRHSNYGMN